MKTLKSLTISTLAVKHYGAEHQKKKAIEEMGELITALSREQDNRATRKDIITEIADVTIMMHQLTEIYGRDAVGKEITRKQKRLLSRMEREQEQSNEQDG